MRPPFEHVQLHFHAARRPCQDKNERVQFEGFTDARAKGGSWQEKKGSRMDFQVDQYVQTAVSLHSPGCHSGFGRTLRSASTPAKPLNVLSQ
jgi:hypothetical protein